MAIDASTRLDAFPLTYFLTLTMIIPISFHSSSADPKLHPEIAKISHDELVLIEFQGSLDVTETRPGEKDGKFIGTLRLDANAVRSISSF